ncbi:MAG: hypothetical protein HOP15_02695 [Planctomycetes bacterium]|nr:hypothetical protein [Planctomycetota bacterium]
MSSIPRIHPVTYPLALHDKSRPKKLHQFRDLCAINELENAIQELGYRHGETIFNQSPPGWPADRPFEMDISYVAERDALLQCMRPPFSDRKEGPKRQIQLANTSLEKLLFAACKRYITWSARTHMLLAESMHPWMKPGFEDRREMTFRQKGWGAPYTGLNAHDGHGTHTPRVEGRTALFLIHLAHAWENGPRFYCAFGQDGIGTVIWAYRLAHDFKHLLRKPGFVVAELELGEIRPESTDLRFCMDWKIEPILVHEETEGAPRAEPELEPALAFQV